MNEYIPRFNPRSKWNINPESQPEINDVVLIEKNCKWMKGVVRKLHNGKDGRIGFFDIYTRDGIVKKHASRILVPTFEEGGDCQDSSP